MSNSKQTFTKLFMAFHDKKIGDIISHIFNFPLIRNSDLEKKSHHIPSKMMKNTCQHTAMALELLICHFLRNLVQNLAAAGNCSDSSQRGHIDLNHS